jgi:virulence-associated protein VapD
MELMMPYGEGQVIGIQWDFDQKAMNEEFGTSKASQMTNDFRNVVKKYGFEKAGGSFYVCRLPMAEDYSDMLLAEIREMGWPSRYLARLAIFEIKERHGLSAVRVSSGDPGRSPSHS